MDVSAGFAESDWLFAATSEAVHPGESGRDPMGSCHSGHDACGLGDFEASGRRDEERSRGDAADDVQCMSCGTERRLRDTDNRDAEGGRGMGTKAWAALRIEGGVTVDHKKLKRGSGCQHCPDAREFSFEQRPWLVRGGPGDIDYVIGRHC